MEDEIIFKDLKIDFQKLLQLGFIKENDYYKYETKIMDNQFSLVIKIDMNNVVCSDVIELSTNEKFMLYYVISATGEFIGKIRAEYNDIIEKVKNTCCSKNIFKSEYANLIIEYIRQKYNDELEYLWDKFPNNAIWRNKDNNKWYGALLIVQKSKIRIEEEGSIEIIDLLLEQEKIEKIVDNKRYFAGYHMNKKHWITIKLDGSVNINEIYEFIDNSYNLSKGK
ncbi:MAG: MmcQ/YjbR family DNA-binding protein [Clostridia bacterium]|nr:MmcQ/YjbR family DNA-binding protein [Clostridia bacterium]